MNTAVVIPVGGGREENLTQVLGSIGAMTMTPKIIVLVCDGEDAWMEESAAALDDLSFRLACRRAGIFPAIFNAAKHEPGMEQPRNIGVRVAEHVAAQNDIKLSHVWFLDSDCIVSKGAMAAFEFANIAAGPGLVAGRVLIGPYDWLAEGYRKEPETIAADLALVEMLREHGYENEANALCRGASIRQMADHLAAVPGADEDAVDALFKASVLFDQLEFRAESFKKHSPLETFTEDLSVGLACFSGNLIWPIEEFKRVGGFWDELHHGRCEDGELGLRAVHMGVPIGFAPDAKAFHLWHQRNNEWAMRANARDVPMLNERHAWVEGRCVCGHERECHRFDDCDRCDCESFQTAVFMVDEDGKRFDARCECGWEGNTLLVWQHRSECSIKRIVP